LKPDIKNCNQTTESEPLKSITVMFVHTRAGQGPVTQQPLAGPATLLNGDGQQRQAKLSTELGQVDILPDQPRLRATKLV